jgi:hypothetical protein
MRSTALWLFATAVFIGASLMIGSLAHAGTTPQPDHLKCYQVVQDTNTREKEIVTLFNQQFGQEPECTLITKAPLFCAPTEKFSRNSPEGDDFRGGALETDFLCYKVQCDNREKQNILVDDQFGTRQITIKDARLLCTPAKKVIPPTPLCENTTAPQCGGFCDVPGKVCKPVAGTANFCRCQ